MKARRWLAPRLSTRHGKSPFLDDVVTVVRGHHPDADVALIQHAHDEAARWHEGQTRRSGASYLSHCLAVAAIVADVGMPPAVVCAALLHDITRHALPTGPRG